MNIKKTIAFLLIFTFLMPNLTFAKTTEKLKYEDACKIAINNNLNLEKTKTSIDDIDESLGKGTGLPENFYIIDPISDITASIGMHEMQSNLDVQKKFYKTQKEAIILGVKNLFYNIEQYEKDEKLLQKELNLKNDEMSIAQVKKNLGLVSDIDYKNEQLEFQKLKNSLEEAKINISNSYSNLNHLLGTDNDKKIEYLDVKYEELSKTKYPIDAMTGQAVSQAPTIFSKNESIRMLEMKMKLGLFNDSLYSLPDEQQRKSLKMMDVDKRLSKENLENAVIEAYNNILKLEETYKNLNFNIENLENQTKNLSLMLSLGNATKFQLKNAEFQLEKLKTERENVIKNHDILKLRYQKPYLLSL